MKAKKLLFTALALFGGLLLAGVAEAAFNTYPAVPGVYYQTSGRERPPTIGDWYTTNVGGAGGTTSTDRLHRVLVEITAAQLVACGGVCDIVVTDAESNGLGNDEVFGAGDPTQFSLRDRSGTTTLQGPVTIASGALDGTTITFTVNAPGVYQITSAEGGFPISGNATVDLNDDDNSWGLQVEGTGTSADGTVGLLRTSFQQGIAGGPTATYDLYFLLGPALTDTTLALRNFDLDGGATVAYTAPGGAVTAGTVSANGVWNNAGTLNVGADSLLANNAPPTIATDTGVWNYKISNWTASNQTIFEVNGAGVGLPLSDLAPTRAGNFGYTFISPPTSCTPVNTPIDYLFRVTNNYFTNDLLNMTLSALPAGWTAQLLTAGGAALTNHDNINGLVSGGIIYAADTDLLAPGQVTNFILRVTPSTTAIGPYVAQINGLSYMDNRVNPASNTIYTISQATYICPILQKTFSPGTVNTGVSTIMSFTLTNRNSVPLTGVTLTDPYPSGMVNTTPLSLGGTCTAVTTTATAGGNSLNVTAATVPAATATTAATCNITSTVLSNTVGIYNNTTSGVSASAGGVPIGPGAPSNTAVLTVVKPTLSFAKTSAVFSDPLNGTTNPKRIPGAFVDYSLALTNTGAGTVDSSTVVIVDPIPANTELFVGNIGAVGSGPVSFTQGTTTSGLTYTFTSLASTTDDVSFSNNGGTSFTYTPVAGANGTDPTVTHIRINPKGVMAGAAGGNNPSFTALFRVRVK